MKYITALLIALILLVNMPTSVLADTADPDSTPTVVRINVYRNLLEDDDRAFLIYANIPYATPPDTTVDETFIWRLIDTDNTTELGSTTGTAYDSSGYGYNVFFMYFYDSDNITWGTPYIIRLSGNPSVFDDPPQYNYTVSSSDYTSLTTTADNQVAFAARVVAIATDLNNKWGLDADEYLTAESETGTTLSLFGQSFFREAIYGLQGMAPAAFNFSIADISLPDRDWDIEYSENLTSQYSGTWIADAQDAGADLFDADYDLSSIILVLVLCVSVFFGNIFITHNPWDAMIDMSLVAVVAARLGLYGLAFLGLLVAMAWSFIGLKLFGLGR